MKKELGRIIWMLIILLLWGILAHFIFGAVSNATEYKTIEFEPLNAQMVQDAKRYTEQQLMDELVTETANVKTSEDAGFTVAEAEMLMKIAMAEAEGEDVEGKAAVMAVVINRLNDARFPDTIEGVIFQNRQFSPIADGRYYTAEPNTECNLALAEVEMGLWKDFDALYFENAKKSWQADNCEYVQTIGHHRFYKN